MLRKLKTIALFSSAYALAGCVSAAEGILDGVAGSVSSVGSKALFNVDEESCRADNYLLAEKSVDLEFYKEKSFELASTQCAAKFDAQVSEADFSRDYDSLVRKKCFTENGQTRQTTFCQESTKGLALVASEPETTFFADKQKMVGYEVGSLACDHEMFKRKPNVARLARIEATTACEKDGRCYKTENLIDRNRSLSPGPSTSWSNDPNSERSVTFTWDTPVADMEQVYLITPHTVPMLAYSIEITTPTGQQVQVARVDGNEEQKLCHRFNPLDVKSMTIEGATKINPSRVFLNEVVVR